VAAVEDAAHVRVARARLEGVGLSLVHPGHVGLAGCGLDEGVYPYLALQSHPEVLEHLALQL